VQRLLRIARVDQILDIIPAANQTSPGLDRS
jgi:hypothetical protein